jgi:hypothetical protein
MTEEIPYGKLSICSKPCSMKSFTLTKILHFRGKIHCKIFTPSSTIITTYNHKILEIRIPVRSGPVKHDTGGFVIQRGPVLGYMLVFNGGNVHVLGLVPDMCHRWMRAQKMRGWSGDSDAEFRTCNSMYQAMGARRQEGQA